MPGKAILSGDLSAFSLSDMFSLISMSKKTGVLRLTRGAESRTLHWEDGEIVFARSNSVRDSLGNFLVRKGIITPEQNASSSSKIDPGTRHGKVLVRMGFITADQLLWAVKQQVIEIVYSLFHWSNGYFEFLDGGIETKEKITLSMSTTKLVMEGIHRLDEWGKFRAAFPDDDLILTPQISTDEIASRPELTADEKRVYRLIDGTRTLGEIVNLARLGEFECYSALFALSAAGAIVIQGTAARRAAR